MQKKNFDKLIAASVLWWTSHLTTHKNEQMIDENVKEFMRLLTEYLKEKSKKGARVILGVDYGPEWPLSYFCQKAGVSDSGFPQKTTMWINFEKETVRWETVRGPGGQVYPAVKKK